MKSHRRLLLLLTVFAVAAGSTRADDAKIAAVLQPFVDSHSLAGAVTLVANKEKVLSLETVGWADIGMKKPMTADTVFWIASMSKPITGTALTLLIDEGKVNPDDPVEKYLPEFRGQMVAVYRDNATVLLKRPKHGITVRNVLSHTSALSQLRLRVGASQEIGESAGNKEVFHAEEICGASDESGAGRTARDREEVEGDQPKSASGSDFAQG